MPAGVKNRKHKNMMNKKIVHTALFYLTAIEVVLAKALKGRTKKRSFSHSFCMRNTFLLENNNHQVVLFYINNFTPFPNWYIYFTKTINS